MRKLVHIQNGDTEVECRVYEVDDHTGTMPYLVETPRGDWKASDLFGALAVAGNFKKLPQDRTVVLK